MATCPWTRYQPCVHCQFACPLQLQLARLQPLQTCNTSSICEIVLWHSPAYEDLGGRLRYAGAPLDCRVPVVQTVEGIVVDVGWYRTTIRSFEREIYTIPNSVFSRNVVLNITRKQKEWRFFEFFGAPDLRL